MHPSGWFTPVGKSWVSQTVPIWRTPGVHLIALKAGSLSAPVIYLFGRGKQGQRQMWLINTLFCGVQLASAKRARAADGGCLFAMKLIFRTAPPAPPASSPTPTPFCHGETLKEPDGKFLRSVGTPWGQRRKRAWPGGARMVFFAKKLLDFASSFFFFFFI